MKRRICVATLLTFLTFLIVLGGCMPPIYSISPRFYVFSLSSDSMFHTYAVYNEGRYIYYDQAGENGAKFYSNENGNVKPISNSETLLKSDMLYDCVICGDNIIYFDEVQGMLFDGTIVNSLLNDGRLHDFVICGDDIIAHGYPAGADDRYYRNYRFPAGKIDMKAEPLKKALLDTGASMKCQGSHVILSDGEYRYIYSYKDFNLDGHEFLEGIVDNATSKVLYTASTSHTSDLQGVVYANGDKIVFMSNYKYNEGKGRYCRLSMLDGHEYTDNFVIFPYNYYYDCNYFYLEGNNLYVLLVNTTAGSPFGPYINEPQHYIVNYALACVDIDTGELTMMYETANNKERIVGYEGGLIYLFNINKRAVFTMNPKAKQKDRFCDLPKYYNYSFEMCGGKLFVWGGDEKGDIAEVFIDAYDLLQ